MVRAPALQAGGHRFESCSPHQKKALANASAFFNEARFRALKNEAVLRPMKRASTAHEKFCALCFMFAEQTLHGNSVAASFGRKPILHFSPPPSLTNLSFDVIIFPTQNIYRGEKGEYFSQI